MINKNNREENINLAHEMVYDQARDEWSGYSLELYMDSIDKMLGDMTDEQLEEYIAAL